MPYIKEDRRADLKTALDALLEVLDSTSAGELNYVVTRIMIDHLKFEKALGYEKVNTLIGVLECAKLELYRRVIIPYEDRKIADNGDVYPPYLATD